MINPIYSPAPGRYESGIRFRRCGRSGILLPEIALGLWHNFGDVNPFANSLEMTHYAFDHGIVHFDLANNYGPSYGSAEETFGQIMKKSFAPYRHALFISSKAGFDMWPGPYGEWGSRKYLMNSLDQSLKRMNLDYVDLFYSHRFDPNTPIEETLQTLVDVVRQGKALYIGISNWPLEPLRKATQYLKERDVPLLIYQGRLNKIDRQPIDEGILNYCHSEGIGFIAYSPLAQGLLTERYINTLAQTEEQRFQIPSDSRMAKAVFLTPDRLTPEMRQYLLEQKAEADRNGRTMAEMSLRWVLEQQGVTSVLVGASSVEQLKTNLACID